MGYVYGPDMSWQTGGYQTPVPDRYANMRGNSPVPPGFYTPPIQEPFLPNPMRNQTQVPPAAPQNSGILWVNGRQEAESYSIDPGCAAAVWDKTSPVNRPVIYLLQADSTGRPFIKTYDLVERIEGNPQPQIPQIDPKQVVTWDALYDAMDDYFTKRLKQPSKSTSKKENVDNA